MNKNVLGIGRIMFHLLGKVERPVVAASVDIETRRCKIMLCRSFGVWLCILHPVSQECSAQVLIVTLTLLCLKFSN